METSAWFPRITKASRLIIPELKEKTNENIISHELRA